MNSIVFLWMFYFIFLGYFCLIVLLLLCFDFALVGFFWGGRLKGKTKLGRCGDGEYLAIVEGEKNVIKIHGKKPLSLKMCKTQFFLNIWSILKQWQIEILFSLTSKQTMWLKTWNPLSLDFELCKVILILRLYNHRIKWIQRWNKI